MKNAAVWPQNGGPHSAGHELESLASFLAEYGIHHIADIRHMSNGSDQLFIPLSDIDRLVQRLSVDDDPHYRLLPLFQLPSVFADPSVRANPVITNGKGEKFTLLFAAFHEEQYWVTINTRKKRSFISKTSHHAVADLRNLIGQLHTPLHRRVFNTFSEFLGTPSSLSP